MDISELAKDGHAFPSDPETSYILIEGLYLDYPESLCVNICKA